MKIFMFLIVLKYATGATMCKSDMEDKCLHPKVFKDLDRAWVAKSNANGWYTEVGNKVARLHFAEIIKGELLPEDSDFSKLCLKGQYKAFAAGYNNGTMSGFEGNTGHWECKGIESEPGALDCTFGSDLTKYEDSLKFYATFSDNKNFYVVVACFPNGEVGWFAHSANYPLAAEERTMILEHVKSLGFSDELVELYEPSCAAA